MQAKTLIHWLSITLPFANEIAIVLTNSKLAPFKTLYPTCINTSLHIKKLKCTAYHNINKIIIDLIAYLGIVLFIGKNTLHYGYMTGVVTGMVVMFWSEIIPTKFLGLITDNIMKWLSTNNSYTYILVGLAVIVLLMVANAICETLAQKVTKKIKIDKESEKHTEK
jgi:hypothetical protein